MPRATTNKSMRLSKPSKGLRRQPIAADGESDKHNRAAGASGIPTHAPKRPGRAAALLSASQRTRSQKWRAPEKGSPSMRRGVLAKGSRTGRNRTRT
jgi:hypothetical protein